MTKYFKHKGEIMSTTNSKTLREFTLKTRNKRGDKFTIRYGYDISSIHPQFYVTAAINGSDFNSTKKTLSKVKSLKIPGMSGLIDLIGSDATGTPTDYESRSENLINSYIQTQDTQFAKQVASFFQISTDGECNEWDTFTEKYEESTTKRRKAILTRYINGRRVKFTETLRDVITALRATYWDGAIVDGKKTLPQFRGILKKHPYPLYYKRDIDYIRKRRIRLFATVLKRKFIPFS